MVVPLGGRGGHGGGMRERASLCCWVRVVGFSTIPTGQKGNDMEGGGGTG